MNVDWGNGLPSRDLHHKEHPETTQWMDSDQVSSDQGRRPATKQRAMSGQVQRLASRLHVDPDELAKKIPPDTLRRTKYAVIEQVQEDGSRIFRHDPQIESGVRAEVRP